MTFVRGVLAGALLSSVVAWAVAYFAPGIWKKLARRPPLIVHVETDPAIMYAGQPNWDGFAFVSDRIPSHIGQPPGPVCREWRRWISGAGIFDADRTELRVSLLGKTDSTVLVDGVRVISLARGSPHGTKYMCPVGGAEGSPRRLELDLDWNPGVVRFVAAGDEPTGPFLLTLARNEVEVLLIEARASRAAVEWTAELLFLVDGKRMTVELNDAGGPFRTSGTDGLPTLMWTGTDWEQR